FSAAVSRDLGLPPLVSSERLAGVGGATPTVTLDIQIQFACYPASTALFRGQFPACTDLASLDMSVLGRDILNLFAVIVDRPRDVVCLLAQDHFYDIRQR